MKMYFLCCWFMTMTIHGLAQDILPGMGAVGYLNYKDVSVDHATGTFHYHVPLWTIYSGGVSIPLRLSYIASGVREGDLPGDFGFNWSLMSGGIVTRVCRGTPDERRSDFLFTYPANSVDTVNWKEWGKRVSRQEVDGENDIFTAVFGERQVYFMLFRQIGGNLVVSPLEKTNVKIEPESSSSNITGWTVTDENGVKYIYRVREWTRRRSSSESISSEPVSADAFVSSWYLSKIEVPNDDAIFYEYRKEYNPIYTADTVGMRIEHRKIENTYRYRYGKPLIEFPFRFDSYKPQYDTFLKEANRLAGGRLYLINNLNQAGFVFQQETDYYSLQNPVEITDRSTSRRWMGMTVDYKSVVETGNSLLNVFRQAQSYYSSGTIRTQLNNSENLLSMCMLEKELVKERDEKIDVFEDIPAVQLKRIYWGGKEIVTEYDEWGKRVTGLVYRDFRHDNIDRVVLENDGLLRKVSWIGVNNSCYQYLAFEYFENLIDGLTFDYWRYPNGFTHKESDPFRTERLPDIQFTRLKTLRKIRTLTGGRIEVDYENNVCAPQRLVLTFASEPDSLYGGIRVKSILMKDGRGGIDTILYRYPEPGIPMFREINDIIPVRYNGFLDIVTRLNAPRDGNLLINKSNNGLYYPYVEEVLVGKGTNNYLFYVPAPKDEVSSSSVAYAYWLYGLPLAKGTYDERGNLVQLKKYCYYADLSQPGIRDGMESFYGTGWFRQGDAAFNCREIRQVKAYRYYIDPAGAKKYFDSQPEISGIFSPKSIYNTNVQPRTGVYVPEYAYRMWIGGLLVPCQEKNIVFEGNISSRVSLEHLRKPVTAGKQMVRVNDYCYENPTRIFGATGMKTTTSLGDTLKTNWFTPLDFKMGMNNVIDRMKSLNVIAPVVREQLLLRKKGEAQYRLVQESVQDFLSFMNTSGNMVFLPWKEKYYAGTALPTANETRPASTECSCPSAYYQEKFSAQYGEYNGCFLTVQTVMPGKQEVLLYDRGRNNLILRARNVTPELIAAEDCLRVIPGESGIPSGMGRFYGTTLPSTLEVSADTDHRRFRVWVMMKPDRDVVNIRYEAGGTTRVTENIHVKSGMWQVFAGDIDLTAVTQAGSLRVSIPVGGKVAALVIAPEDAIFEMSSRDAAGRLFGSFDQTRMVRFLEYDAAGRIWKIYDGRGVVTEERKYEFNQ